MDKPDFEEESAKVEARKGRPAITQPVLLGITSVVQTRSFFSAPPSRNHAVLTEPRCRQDRYARRPEGERHRRPLIPAGTGAYLAGLQRIATKRDEDARERAVEVIEEQLPAEIAAAAEAEARPPNRRAGSGLRKSAKRFPPATRSKL